MRFLGTGAENADPSRAESSTLVSCGELRMLVDVGRGSIMRLAQSGVGVGEITAVLLTHLHLDHVAESRPSSGSGGPSVPSHCASSAQPERTTW